MAGELIGSIAVTPAITAALNANDCKDATILFEHFMVQPPFDVSR
jgi:hypothetical protein